MTRQVLLTGGTGVLGRVVATELAGRGHRVRVLSRQHSPLLPGVPADAPAGARIEAVHGDLATGDGLAAGLADVDSVVHCASDPRRYAELEVAGTRRLLTAAREAGGPHVLYVSIVGCDQIPYGYYRSKALAELAVAQSGLPWTVLRATQFHDLIFSILYALTRMPVVPVPRGLRDQPIDVRDVAPRLVELVEAGPAGRADDIGGPEVLTLDEALADVQRALGTRRRTVPLPLAGKTIRAFRAGHHLAAEHAVGSRSFGEYVQAHVHADPADPSGRPRADVAYRWRA